MLSVDKSPVVWSGERTTQASIGRFGQMAPSLFEITQQEDVLLLAPQRNLGELELTSLDSELRKLVSRVGADRARHVVIDLAGTDYYGSTALGLFLVLWKEVCRHDGRMVFCNVSPHELEVLQLTRLDNFWPIYETRAEALAQLTVSQS